VTGLALQLQASWDVRCNLQSGVLRCRVAASAATAAVATRISANDTMRDGKHAAKQHNAIAPRTQNIRQVDNRASLAACVTASADMEAYSSSFLDGIGAHLHDVSAVGSSDGCKMTVDRSEMTLQEIEQYRVRRVEGLVLNPAQHTNCKLPW